MTTRRVLVFVLALAAAPSLLLATGAADEAPVPPTLRLGDAVKPLREVVDVTLVPTQETFSGSVDIDLELKVATPIVWLNGSALKVREASLSSGGRTQAARPLPGGEAFLGFALDGPVGPGPARLHIAYEGVLSRKDSEGLFAQEEGGEWYAFSHFEPMGARRAFPCFDEPSFKIPWQVTLHVRPADVALSNTPEASSSQGADGLRRVAFAETKPLPSYLVAVAAGPFELLDAGKAGRKATPVRIVVPKGRGQDARWAVESTGKILALLEDYFDSAYPYPKLDQIAVPQFGGAMENPGLVTYSHWLLIHKPDEETIQHKRAYVGTAAHELAHQWFGDLVTMAWWDDVWLNESFASWMGEKIRGRFGPDWGVDIGRVTGRSRALSGDSLASARRIRQPIESKHDVANAFDGITYGKGEAVLEMFETWVGEAAFRKGVQRYLKQHAWGNATAADFLGAVSADAGRDLKAPFSTFLDQAGAPLVEAELRCEAGAPPRVDLTQQRYLPLGSQGATNVAWQIPVCVRYGAGGVEGRECTLLKDHSAQLTLTAAKSCPQWMLANDGSAGYYRARYAPGELARLLGPSGPRLAKAERVGLLGDAAALVTSGGLAASEALEIASGLAGDPDRQIVSGTIGVVRSLWEFVPDPQRSTYAAFVRKLYGERARALGWKPKAGEAEEERLLRVTLLGIVGARGEDPAVGAEAVALTQRWLEDPRAVDPELLDTVLSIAGRFGDRPLFDRLHEELKKAEDRQRRRHLWDALGSFRDPAIVRSALQLTLEEGLDPRESLAVLFFLTDDPTTRPLAYDFVKQNYEALIARLPRGSTFDGGSLLVNVGGRFCDEGHRADVEAFFGPKAQSSPGAPRTLAQTLERIDLCIAQRRVLEPSLASFFREQGARGGAPQ